MRIGMRGHDFGAHPPSELARLYHEHGVQAVQLAIPKAVPGVDSYFDVDTTLLEQLAAQLAAADVAVPVLGCYIEPALKDEAERQRQVEVFLRGMECAAALGAGCIGTETTAYTGDDIGRERAYTRLCRSLDTALARAQALGVTVAVEPVAWHTLNSPQLAARLDSQFAGAPLAFIFDPVNLLTPTTGAGQQALWRECLDAFGGKIMALHVKDALPADGAMRPCPLGEGEMDYAPVLAPWLREHQPDICLLREETSLQTAQSDFAWMRRVFL